MLQEITFIKQHKDEPRRRWFEDEDFDLIVWFDENEEIIEFELCYNKSAAECAVRWEKTDQYSHYRVDDGDRPGKHKASPILIPNGYFHRRKIAALFKIASVELDKRIAKFVHDKITRYPLSLKQVE